VRSLASVTKVLVVVAALTGGVLTAGDAAATAPTGAVTEPAGIPTAHHFRGIPTVGPLFPPGGSVHTCTASVVASPVGDLLITAAHCMAGTAGGYTFAPGYHDGVEPFGLWTVVGAYGAPEWIAHQTPERDVAFLRVAPRQVDGHAEQIQEVTGANQLGTAPTSGKLVTVPAYAVGQDDEPITCSARVYFRGPYPAFNCNPYVDGTSGAPWLQHRGKDWIVVGIIGGLHQGGCYAWTSYSAPFGLSTSRTYADAASGGEPVSLPPAGSDGCTTGL